MDKIVIKDANCSIGELYNRIAVTLGLNPDEIRYNCTKVLVSPIIQEEIFAYYENKGITSDSYAMSWVCFGPKAVDTLDGYEVIVEDGWYKPINEEDN